MTTPHRKPYFCDAIGGTEATFPETGPEMAWLIDSMVSTVTTFPLWRLDNDSHEKRPVRLSVIEHRRGTLARLGFACGGADGVITLRPDAETGFVRVTAGIGDAETFLAYMDRPYEEYALYPPGDRTAQDAEGPGRMSKHRWWISLSASAWPVLAPLATNGWFNAEVPDR
jgi:hypothetical protein